MENPEAIQEIKNVRRTKVVDCGEEEEALIYAITILERVEKVLSQNRFRAHEIAHILRGEEFP